MDVRSVRCAGYCPCAMGELSRTILSFAQTGRERSSERDAHRTLMDLNGDGVLDRVSKPSSDICQPSSADLQLNRLSIAGRSGPEATTTRPNALIVGQPPNAGPTTSEAGLIRFRGEAGLSIAYLHLLVRMQALHFLISQIPS